MRYNNFGAYMRRRYGKNLEKICLDGGFTCPNRDGKCGVGGCIFCGERGAGEHIGGKIDLSAQVASFFRARPKVKGAIAYFQNFTSTYAPVEVLREKYLSALCDDRIVALAIGTRPDCIDEGVAELLSELSSRVDVWVELGLQTASDRTADIINRGYHRDTFERAMELLKKYGIDVCVHLIVGLPGENMEDIKETCRYLQNFKHFGIKIHSIYVMRGTKLAEMYEHALYTPPSMEYYVDAAAYILTHIHPETVVHRLTGDCPADMLIAPMWNKNKHALIDCIVSKMMREGLSQGAMYGK